MNFKKEVKIMQTNTIFSVFVENLSELNEGNMVGCWVEFPCDYDEWKTVLAKIGNPEEIIITDIDNYTNLEILPINEYSSYRDIQELAEYIEYLQDDQYKEDLFIAVYNSVTSDFEEAKEAVEKERYTLMQNYTMAEYCEMLAKECYTIPDELAPYIDWESYAHDFSTSGYTETEKGVLIEEF